MEALDPIDVVRERSWIMFAEGDAGMVTDAGIFQASEPTGRVLEEARFDVEDHGRVTWSDGDSGSIQVDANIC